MARFSEEEYREALELWLENNPGKNINNIQPKDSVTLINGKVINLGFRINNIRKVFNGTRVGNLSDEQGEYWINKHGLYIGNKFVLNRSRREENYREALEIWLRDNPGKNINDVGREEVILLDNGIEVKLGIKINNIKQTLKNNVRGSLDLDQKKYWIDEKRLNVDCKYTEEDYREALEIWLSENPGKDINDIKQKEIVKLSNGKIIRLGTKISKIKSVLTGKRIGKLSEEKREYWVIKHGLSLESKKRFFSEDEYREALEIWLRDNPGKNINDIKQKDVVIIGSGKNVNLGIRLNNIRSCLKSKGTVAIDEEQKEYWIKKHGLREYKTTRKNNNSLLKAILDYLNLNSRDILNDIATYGISVEKAIGYSMVRNSELSKLDKLFYSLMDSVLKTDVDNMANILISLIDDFSLSLVEREEILNLFFKYINIIRKYQIADVGLEVDNNRRYEKINNYNLNDEEVDESLFVPLSFDRNYLDEERGKLYMRRSYIMNWSNYTETEKEDILLLNNFSDYELDYLNKISVQSEKLVKLKK